MYEAAMQELQHKKQMSQLESQAAAQNANATANFLADTGKVIQQGMSAYAQTKWNSMKYDLEREASEVAEEYLDVNNENASKDYATWVSNLIDTRLSEQGALVKAYAKDQKQELVDKYRAAFDKSFISAINDSNWNTFEDNWDKIIETWNTTRDISQYDTDGVFTIKFVNGVPTKQKVNVESPFEYDSTKSLDDKSNNFNYLKNVLYKQACSVMDKASALEYVKEREANIEQKCMVMDIAQLVNELIEDKEMTQSKIIDAISAQYFENNKTPYTGKDITADEAYSYNDIIEQYVKKAWQIKQAQMADRYETMVLPSLYNVEASGAYITSKVFKEALEEAEVDSRFITSTLASWDNTLKRNDAMAGLDEWFANGNPMSNELTSYQKNFVYQDSKTGLWTYSNDAGYILISGERDSSVQEERIAEVNRTYEEEGLSLSIEGKGYETEGNLYVRADVLYGRGLDTNEGIDFVITNVLANEVAYLNKQGIDYSNALNGFSEDPMRYGLSNKQIEELHKLADENNTYYLDEYIKKYCKDNDYYDMRYNIFEALLGAEGVSSYAVADTINQRCRYFYENTWYNDFKGRYTDWQNRVGAWNGSLANIGEGVYVPSSPSTKTPTSSSSAGTSAVASSSGDFTSFLKSSASQVEQDTVESMTPRTAVAGGILFTETIKEALTGGFSIPELRAAVIDSGMYTEEQKEAIRSWTSSQLAEEAIGNKRIYDQLNEYIKDLPTEFDRQTAWLGAIGFLVRNEGKVIDDSDGVIASWISTQRDTVADRLVTTLRNGNNNVYNALQTTTKGKNKGGVANSVTSVIEGISDERISGDNNYTQNNALSGLVDDFINQGTLDNIKDYMPSQLLSVFAGKDYAKLSDNEKTYELLKAACYILNEPGVINDKTDLENLFKEWNSTLFYGTDSGSKAGQFKSTDSKALELADKMNRILAVAGELKAVSEAMVTLENPDLNIGSVLSVDGNKFKMSSGVTVLMSMDNNGKAKYDVVSLDGKITIDVNEFFSKSVLERYSRAVTDDIVEDEAVKGFALDFMNNVDVTQDTTHKYSVIFGLIDSTRKAAYKYATGEWRIVDGQASKDFCETFGYSAPQLYSGAYIDGTYPFYKITTDSNSDFSDKLPYMGENNDSWLTELSESISKRNRRIEDNNKYINPFTGKPAKPKSSTSTSRGNNITAW